jgi:hypothetical protein
VSFAISVQLLVNQVGHWTPARWRGNAEPVRHLVQEIADAAADAENQPHRRVPILADTALADQVRVLAADLLAANPDPDLLARMESVVASCRAEIS